MQDSKHSPISKIAKGLFVLLLKVLAVAAALVCRCLSLLLTKISEILEKLSGHGTSSH